MDTDDAALHAVLDCFRAEHFSFIFVRRIELVHVGMHHLAVLLGGFKNDVKGFFAAAVITFVTLWKRADEVHQFRAAVKPLAGFRINHAFQRLIAEFDCELILIVLTGLETGCDRAVLRLRVDIHKGADGGNALADHQFKELAEPAVIILDGRVLLQLIEHIPFLLQRISAADFQHLV